MVAIEHVICSLLLRRVIGLAAMWPRAVHVTQSARPEGENQKGLQARIYP